MRILLLLAELNELEVRQTDIDKIDLETNCTEKVYFISGTEFRSKEMKYMVIENALYVLQISSLLCHKRFAIFL